MKRTWTAAPGRVAELLRPTAREPGRLVAGPLRGLRFDLPSFARLDVVSAAPQLAENARLLHLPLERLERPVEAIGFTQNDFWH